MLERENNANLLDEFDKLIDRYVLECLDEEIRQR